MLLYRDNNCFVTIFWSLVFLIYYKDVSSPTHSQSSNLDQQDGSQAVSMDITTSTKSLSKDTDKASEIDLWKLELLNPFHSIQRTRGIFKSIIGLIFAPTFAYQTFKKKKNLDKLLDEEIEPSKSEIVEKNASSWNSEFNLSSNDQKILKTGGDLNEKIIFAAMQLIRNRNHEIRGMIPCTTAHGLNFTFADIEFIQILKSNSENHWLVVRGINDIDRDKIEIYDSYHETVISEIPEQIGALLRTRKKMFSLFRQWCPFQTTSNISALHAIANLTELALEQDSYKSQNWKWKEDELGTHLIECIDQFTISPFPKINTTKITRIFMLPEESWKFEVMCICRQPIIDKSPYENNKKKQRWVQCSNLQCKRWFHISCALMLEPNINSLLDGSWVCLVCEKKRGIFIKQSLIRCLFFDYFLKYSTYLNFYFIYQVIHTRKEP